MRINVAGNTSVLISGEHGIAIIPSVKRGASTDYDRIREYQNKGLPVVIALPTYEFILENQIKGRMFRGPWYDNPQVQALADNSTEIWNTITGTEGLVLEPAELPDISKFQYAHKRYEEIKIAVGSLALVATKLPRGAKALVWYPGSRKTVAAKHHNDSLIVNIITALPDLDRETLERIWDSIPGDSPETSAKANKGSVETKLEKLRTIFELNSTGNKVKTLYGLAYNTIKNTIRYEPGFPEPHKPKKNVAFYDEAAVLLYLKNRQTPPK